VRRGGFRATQSIYYLGGLLNTAKFYII